MMGHYSYMPWFGVGMALGPLMMIAFWALVIGGIVFLIRGSNKPSKKVDFRQTDTKTAMDILRERLARGEIDSKQFAEMRQIIEH